MRTSRLHSRAVTSQAKYVKRQIDQDAGDFSNLNLRVSDSESMNIDVVIRLPTLLANVAFKHQASSIHLTRIITDHRDISLFSILALFASDYNIQHLHNPQRKSRSTRSCYSHRTTNFCYACTSSIIKQCPSIAASLSVHASHFFQLFEPPSHSSLKAAQSVLCSQSMLSGVKPNN